MWITEIQPRTNADLLGAKAALSDKINSETAEPMSAFVMFACHGGEAGGTMSFSDGGERGTARVVGGKAGDNAFEHPGAAEVQAIEMRELGIAAIADDDGSEPVAARGTRQIRQEGGEPAREFGRRQHAEIGRAHV